jgi:tRNA(adenine34) deaminase
MTQVVPTFTGDLTLDQAAAISSQETYREWSTHYLTVKAVSRRRPVCALDVVAEMHALNYALYLDLTLEEAERARSEGSVPIGSVIVASDGSVVSRGRNRVLSQGDQTAHSETDAIRSAGATIAPIAPGAIIPQAGSGYVLYTSVEPCLMCLGAILLCPIETVVWAAKGVTGGAYDAVLASGYQNERLQALRIVSEPSAKHRSRSRELLLEFFQKQGNWRLANLLAGS